MEKKKKTGESQLSGKLAWLLESFGKLKLEQIDYWNNICWKVFFFSL